MIAPFRNIAHQNAQKINATPRLITPDDAREMLATMQYQYQRPIDKGHVARLAKEIEEGRFTPGTPIRIATVGDAAFLLDGQHRLSAVVKAQQGVVFTVIEEVAGTADYVAWAYGKTDRGKQRNTADLYRTLDLSEETGLTGTQIIKLSGAVDLLNANRMVRPSMKNRIDDAARVALLRLYAPYMQQWGALTQKTMYDVRRATERSYVVAVAMVLLRYCPVGRTVNDVTPTVEDFWHGALRLTGVQEPIDIDPRYHVHLHLQRTKMTTGSANPSSGVVSADYGSRYLIAAFNKYMRHETVKLIRVNDPKSPIVIEGIDPALDWTA